MRVDAARSALRTADISRYSASDVRAMSYNDLIGLVRETNRFPGGRRSIYLVASRLMLNPQSRVLEVGCATGATSIELSRLVGCHPTAIDINPASIEEAKRRAAEVDATVRFEVADATRLPFDNSSFDVVICGNVTVLISDKSTAVSEFARVLRNGGFLVGAPMYYVRTPPDTLVEKVRAAIHVDIPVLYRNDCVEFFRNIGFEYYDGEDFKFNAPSKDDVSDFCRDILGREHLSQLSADAKSALDEVYLDRMLLFRENIKLLGFTIIFLRKSKLIEDPELFTARPIQE